MKRLFFSIILFTTLVAESNNAGASFRIPVGPKAGMGNAAVALQQGGFQQFANPALLAAHRENIYAFSHNQMALDRSVTVLSVNRCIEPAANFAFSYYRAGTKNIIARDYEGEKYGEVDAADAMGMMSFALSFNPRFSIGLNMKAYFSTLDGNSGNGIGLDAGLRLQPIDALQLGLMLRNIMGSQDWKVENSSGDQRQYQEKMPKQYVFGGSWKQSAVTIAAQSEITQFASDYAVQDFSAGLAYDVELSGRVFSLRAGLNRAAFTTGFGTEFSAGPMALFFDYALNTGQVGEGLSHSFSFYFKKRTE